MTFSERMKDFAAKAGERAQDLSEKGYKASKQFLNKAGAHAQKLGTQGVLVVEIKQLEGQAQRLLGKLGNEVYHCVAELGVETLTKDTQGIKSLLTEITSIKDKIEAKDKELKSLKVEIPQEEAPKTE